MNLQLPYHSRRDEVGGTITEEDWENFRQTVVRRMKTRSKLGEYAVETRKRKL